MTARAPHLSSLALGFIVAACAAADTEESVRIVEVLGLRPGMVVADVGAGDGEWTLVLAEAVGAEGAVFATEVEEDLVEQLEELGLEHFRANVAAVLGNDKATGLGANCCDAMLLRMVYHHFTDPEAMRADILAALRPGARIAVIDIVPQTTWRDLDGVPDRGGHGIALDELIAEMTGAGFVVEAVHANWRGGDEDRYCVVFTAPSGGT